MNRHDYVKADPSLFGTSVQDNAETVGGDSRDSQPDAGVRRSHAIGGLWQPLGRHNKGLDQSETEQQDRGARLAGQREHVGREEAPHFFRFPTRHDHTFHRRSLGIRLFSSEHGTWHRTCINNRIFTFRPLQSSTPPQIVPWGSVQQISGKKIHLKNTCNAPVIFLVLLMCYCCFYVQYKLQGIDKITGTP